MWRFALIIVASGLLTCVGASKGDLGMFDGTWKVARYRRYAGESDRPNGHIVVVFRGNELTVRTRDSEVKGTFGIDSTTIPKTFNLRGKLWKIPVTILGCYRLLDGDAMQLRWSEQGKRPSGFSSSHLEKGEAEVLLIREKPAA